MRRLMYIENKVDGEARIGWVEISRSFRSYQYAGRRLLRLGSGYKYNCIEEGTGEEYWVSGPHRDGADKLHGGIVRIDEDARLAYWTEVRALPALVALREYRAGSSTRTGGSTRQLGRRSR